MDKQPTQLEDAPRLPRIPKSECPDIWIRLPRHKWRKSSSDIADPVVLLERICTVTHSQASIMYTWDALHVNANRTKVLLRSTEKCSNHEFLLGQPTNYQGGRSFTQRQLRGPSTWKDMLKKCMERSFELANKKRQSICTRFRTPAWMITASERKNWKRSENLI